MNAVVAVNVEPAGELLISLREMGLRVYLGEDNGIKVSPRDRVTQQLRSRIQALRDGLLVHLAAERKAAKRLEGRVQEMAQRWGYSAEEIEEAVFAARLDALGWETLCADDECSARKARQAGLRYPA
jgi:hypothetical protein